MVNHFKHFISKISKHMSGEIAWISEIFIPVDLRTKYMTLTFNKETSETPQRHSSEKSYMDSAPW